MRKVFIENFWRPLQKEKKIEEQEIISNLCENLWNGFEGNFKNVCFQQLAADRRFLCLRWKNFCRKIAATEQKLIPNMPAKARKLIKTYRTLLIYP